VSGKKQNAASRSKSAFYSTSFPGLLVFSLFLF